MATYDHKLDRANVYVNGSRLLGQLESITLPEVELAYQTAATVGDATEQYVPMNLARAMTAEFSLRSVNPAVLKSLGSEDNVVVRGRALRVDGSAYGMVATLTGYYNPKFKSISGDGEDSGIEVSVMVNYYKLEMDGSTVHEIGGPEQKLIVNGRDLNPSTFV